MITMRKNTAEVQLYRWVVDLTAVLGLLAFFSACAPSPLLADEMDCSGVADKVRTLELTFEPISTGTRFLGCGSLDTIAMEIVFDSLMSPSGELTQPYFAGLGTVAENQAFSADVRIDQDDPFITRIVNPQTGQSAPCETQVKPELKQIVITCDEVPLPPAEGPQTSILTPVTQ